MHFSQMYVDVYNSARNVPVSLFVRVCHFQQFFSQIMTVYGCERELNAHFYSAASLKDHAPDT